MAEVIAYDPTLHTGRASAERCGQGGSDGCTAAPEFSIRSDRHTISSCASHLAGAVRQAEGMHARRR